MNAGDIARIKAAKEDLEKSMQHIGEAMSKAGAQGGQPHEGQAAGSGQQQQHPHGGQAKEPDEIQDAEVEIIDDDKDKK